MISLRQVWIRSLILDKEMNVEQYIKCNDLWTESLKI